MEKTKTDNTYQESKMKNHTFNGKYQFVANIGKGKTAKVYMARDIEDPDKHVALKIIRHKYLLQAKKNIHTIEKEIEILRGLNHQNVVRIEDFGSEGFVTTPSKKEIKN